ncbi:hypothetical protein FH972_024295 [Carpinus fangiana]|uniref:Uncharacterized protein n=1 Tax=Carpinus fangiana TaxID=176857 RepID=A0A5N6KXM9_9ROSI|nr:hypothetical protein FH972_024295 [Carpinus fangiana]
MFARCGPATSSSTGQAGLSARRPTIAPMTFRYHRLMSNGHTLTDDQTPHTPSPQFAAQSVTSAAMNEAELSQQLDLQSPSDVLRRIFLGPHAKIRSRDINYRIQAIQRRAPARQAELQRWSDEGVSQERGVWGRRVRPAEAATSNSDTNNSKTATMITMDLLRFQLKACNTPEDLLHVLGVASKSSNPHTLQILGSQSIQNIILNKIQHMGATWDDFDVARTIGFINTLYARFEAAGIEFDSRWISLALRKALSVLETDAVRHWLLILSQRLRADGYSSMSNKSVLDLLKVMQEAIKAAKKGMTEHTWLRKSEALIAILTDLPHASTHDAQHSSNCSLSVSLNRGNLLHMGSYLTVLSYLAPAATPELLQREYELASPIIQQSLRRAMAHGLLRLGDATSAWTLVADSERDLNLESGDKLWLGLFKTMDNIPVGLLEKPENLWLKDMAERAFSHILEKRLDHVEAVMGIKVVIIASTGD